MTRERLTTPQKGYGYRHRKERARLLPRAYGQPCPLCGGVMLPGQDLDLHHIVAIADGGKHGPRAIAHAACNRRDGQALATQRRMAGRAPQPQRRVVNSRRW